MSESDSRLSSLFKAIADQSLPPVQTWHPTNSGDIAIRIARNGDWFYQGSLIERARMVKLFSTVLRMDDDGHTYLVTPQERLKITVDDAPFKAVLVDQHGSAESQTLIFTTNVGEQVIADEQHPITVVYDQPGGEPSPYLLVRDRLRALISRPVFIELADIAEERDGVIGLESRGCFMRLSEP